MFLKVSEYKNLLDEVFLTSTNIESSISSFKLTFDSYKNEEVEWKMKLPMFVDSFYSLVLKNQLIPNQIELLDCYLNQSSLKEILSTKANDNADIVRGIKARLFRSYPSLVRDLHFCLFLKERTKNGARVIYNIKLDTEVGIDILIEHNTNIYAINLFTPTSRAKLGRTKKAQRHEIVSNVIQIELPVDFKTERKCGDFFLYGQSEFEILKNLIKQNTLHK